MKVLTWIAAVLLFGCATQRRQVTFDPLKTHNVSFSRSRGCPEEASVTIVVDSAEYRMQNRTDRVTIMVREGIHSFFQYVSGYEVHRWLNQEITGESFYRLDCFQERGPKDKLPTR